MPRPRTVFLPLVLVCLVLLLVLGIVLSANGGRNLAVLLKALDIPLPQFVSGDPPRPATIDSGAAAHWPWLKGVSQHPEPRLLVPTPEKMCETLAAVGQEPPTFTRSDQDGWECSALVTQPAADPAGASLFLQVRGGADGRFTAVRVKFNLADGPLTRDLSRRALDFLHSAMTLPPSEKLDDELQERMAGRKDFYFIAGYHALSFRRETGDPNRYNLLGFNQRAVSVEPIVGWPKPREAARAGAPRASKGPRLSVPSAGSRGTMP